MSVEAYEDSAFLSTGRDCVTDQFTKQASKGGRERERRAFAGDVRVSLAKFLFNMGLNYLKVLSLSKM